MYIGALNRQPNKRANLANYADALQAISRDLCSDRGSSHSILVLKGKTKRALIQIKKIVKYC